VVIGASAGGITAVKKLLSLLPENPDAAFLVVLHQSPESDSKIIRDIFKKSTTLNCIVPENENINSKRKPLCGSFKLSYDG
jgi:chemotaxis response regulator CheB